MKVNGIEIENEIVDHGTHTVYVATHTLTESDQYGNEKITVTYTDLDSGKEISEVMYQKIVED